MLDLKPHLHEPDTLGLLALSVYPDPARLERARRQYQERGHWLLGLEEGGHVVGLIGLELTGPGRATIQHIGVRPDCRNQGTGRKLIDGAIIQLGLDTLQAETDADAARFYERCGFAVTSLGEVYPGVERFRAVRTT
ncbi:GNAT family N-acetyltransferase [Deinococcus sp.]|uniref:GNAT family N-acetyltransferase n=1 Tax=Deinococcus sp. TaxID=47478 RepID=UPI0025E7737C|nr:GNAT family N-acetyltransferase [Deinococcus sp.]